MFNAVNPVDPGHRAVATHEQGPKRLFEAVDAYLEGKRLHCSPRTIEFEEEWLIAFPLNASALAAIARMVERADLLGHNEPDHFLWTACQWGRCDATQPMSKWDTASQARRDAESNGGVREERAGHTDGYALKPPQRRGSPTGRGARRPYVTVTSQFAFGGIAALR